MLAVVSAAMTILVPTVARAQNLDDFDKFDFALAYSNGRIDDTGGLQTVREYDLTYDPCTAEGAEAVGSNFAGLYCGHKSFNGFETSATLNVTRFIGVQAVFSGHFNSQTVTDTFDDPAGPVIGTVEDKRRLYNMLGGVQLKDNRRTTRFRPHGHALVGAARENNTSVQSFSGSGQSDSYTDSQTSLATSIGGGLDVRLSPKVELRVIQVSVNSIFGHSRTLDDEVPGLTVDFAGRTAHNVTFGIGIVFH